MEQGTHRTSQDKTLPPAFARSREFFMSSMCVRYFLRIVRRGISAPKTTSSFSVTHLYCLHYAIRMELSMLTGIIFCCLPSIDKQKEAIYG
jgi:hypothetical protein